MSKVTKKKSRKTTYVVGHDYLKAKIEKVTDTKKGSVGLKINLFSDLYDDEKKKEEK